MAQCPGCKSEVGYKPEVVGYKPEVVRYKPEVDAGFPFAQLAHISAGQLVPYWLVRTSVTYQPSGTTSAQIPLQAENRMRN